MRIRHAIAITFLLILTAAVEATAYEQVTMEVDGRKRSCWVHVPEALDREKPAPLVLLFHGAGANGKWQIRYSGLAETADEGGFLVACPDGTGPLRRWLLTWNAGSCCGFASSKDVDDVEYVRQLLDELAQRYRVNPRRVYLAGLSNGGMMCYRLADALSDRIAAIAIVAGTHLGDPPSPERPVPVLHFHGTKDKLVPFDGGSDFRWSPQYGFPGARECAAMWAEANRCEAKPQIKKLEDEHDNDGTTVSIERYAPRADGAEVVLYVIDGGGHTWPGRTFFSGLEVPPFVRRLSVLGRTSLEVEASPILWEFFQRYTLPKHLARENTKSEKSAAKPEPGSDSDAKAAGD